MDSAASATRRRPEPSFAELFTPKLITLLREGYSAADFRADALAGLTVAIVALPLSMAIAIGSGLSPEKGLFTAIVGGFLISALGGSRFQIGGPAGAFIVLIAAIVERQGHGGLVLATLMGSFQAGHLHQVYPVPRDGGLHCRHRSNHFREPDKRTSWARHRA